jgi:hypothetical protein
MYGDVLRKTQSHIVRVLAGSNLFPSIVEDRSRLDRRHGKGHCLDFQTAGFDDVPLKDRVFLEFNDRAVRLDGPPGNVHDDALPEVLDAPRALCFDAALIEDLDAHGMVKDRLDVGLLLALSLVVVHDVYPPEQRFRAGLGIDGGGLEVALLIRHRQPLGYGDDVNRWHSRRGGRPEQECDGANLDKS